MSQDTDARNQGDERARLTGVPRQNPDTGEPTASDPDAPVQVVDEDGKPRLIQRRSGREEMLGVIANRRRRHVAGELADEGALAEQVASEMDDIPDDGDRLQTSDGDLEAMAEMSDGDPPAPDPAPASREPEDDLIEVVVYGETLRVPRADVDAAGGVRAYQMQAAAEHNFEDSRAMRRAAREEADRILNEARREAEELRTRASAAPPAAPAARAPDQEPAARETLPPPRKPDPNAEIGEDGLTAAQRSELKRLSEEYSDDAVETRRIAYLGMNQRQAETQALVDPAQIAKQAATEAIAEREAQRAEEEAAAKARKRKEDFERRRVEANAYFTEHYGDIERDPDLALVASRKIQELRAADPHRPLLEVVREAGDHVRKKFGTGNGTLRRRAQRKESMPRATQPTAGARVVPRPEPTEPEQKTPQQVIREMALARGQQ